MNMYASENKIKNIELSLNEIELVELLYKMYLDNLKKCKDKEIARELGNFYYLDRYMADMGFKRFGNVLVELNRVRFVDVNERNNIVLTDRFFQYVGKR